MLAFMARVDDLIRLIPNSFLFVKYKDTTIRQLA